jgi:hypothetical protein
MRSLASLLIAASATGFVLTGCTAQAAPVVSPTASAPGVSALGMIALPAKNLEQNVLPLDKYLLGDMKNSDYAENLLMQPCMGKAGFDWNVPWRDTHSNDGPSWNAAHVRLFNLTLAKQWGYHLAPSPDTSLAALRAFQDDLATISDAEFAAFKTCLSRARKELPILPGSAQRATVFAQAAYEGALKDEKVLKAAADWRKCMTPAGISDLPDVPSVMPSESIARKFDIKLQISSTPPVVSQAEIKLATMDFECRDKAGYDQAFYDAQWNRQAKLLAENADELERVAAEISKHAAKVMAVIASNAPSH